MFLLYTFDIIIFFLLTDKSAVYSQAPSTDDLMVRVACNIPAKWYEIGILLKIETSTLNTFEPQTSNPVRLCIMVFDQWKKEQKVPFTWETIITALDTLGEKKTAADIREWLNA